MRGLEAFAAQPAAAAHGTVRSRVRRGPVRQILTRTWGNFVRPLWLALAFTAGCSNDTCRAFGDGHSACGARLSRIPLIGADGAFIVKGRVNGHDAELVVDTGADSTVISSELLSVPDRTPQRLSELCLGDFCVSQEPVYAWETPFSGTNSGEPQGFVGMSLLRHLTLRFHFGAELTIGDGSDGCRGLAVPLAFTDAEMPTAPVAIDGMDLGDIALDTGSTWSVLDQSTADLLGSYLTDEAVLTERCTVDGCTEDGAKLSVLRQWCVGEVCAEQTEVKFPVWNAVGANWFARHDVRFDFQERALIFCDL